MTKLNSDGSRLTISMYDGISFTKVQFLEISGFLNDHFDDEEFSKNNPLAVSLLTLSGALNCFTVNSSFDFNNISASINEISSFLLKGGCDD